MDNTNNVNHDESRLIITAEYTLATLAQLSLRTDIW